MNEADPKTPCALLRFGDFTLNLQRRGLFRGEERVRITGKPLETLIFLVENRGRVVQKQQILNAVWKDIFVTEDTLVHAIREIRRALGDDRDNPLFVLTVPREGYRFICEVVSQPESEVLPVKTNSATLSELSIEADALTSSIPAKIASIVDATPPRHRLVPLLLGLLVVASTLWIVTQTSVRYRLSNWLTLTGTKSLKPLPRTTNKKLLTVEEFGEGKPALSGDGKLLLYVSSCKRTEERTKDGKIKTFGDLFVKEVATGNANQVTFQENPTGDIPTFTADNSYVVFSNYAEKNMGSTLPNLYRVGSSGGRYDSAGNPVFEKKTFIKEASGAGFSPDGQWVAYTKHLPTRKALWISPANNPESDHKEIAENGFTPRWSADGKWLAYTTSNPNGGLGDIWVMDAATLTGQRNLTNDSQQMYGLTWSPDGRFLIFSSKRTGPSLLWIVSFEGGKSEPLTGPVGDFSTPSMSREGNTLVFSYYHGAQNLFLAEGPDLEARDLTTDEYHKSVRLSPSGQLVASIVEQPDFGEHLYVTDLSGRHTRLSDQPSHHPSWSSDKILSYLRWDQSSQQTRVLRVNIENFTQPVTTPLTKPFAGRAEWLDINPSDPTKLVVVLAREGKQQIVLHDVTTNRDTVIDEGREYASLRWSKDGTMLAWSGPEAAGEESAGIWLIKPGIETAPHRLVATGFGPVWSSDNTRIYFSRIGVQSGLWEFDLKLNKENPHPIREWRQTASFDLVDHRLVYCELGSSGKIRVYSLTLE